jgi:hypothetical protein
MPRSSIRAHITNEGNETEANNTGTLTVVGTGMTGARHMTARLAIMFVRIKKKPHQSGAEVPMRWGSSQTPPVLICGQKCRD